MKKVVLPLVILTSLLASCGNTNSPSNAQSTNTGNATTNNNQTIPNSGNIQALYLNTACKTYTYGAEGSSCNNNQRAAVEMAGELYYRAGQLNHFTYSDFNTTLGAAYINGKWEISAFDGSTANAKDGFRKAVAEKGGNLHWNEPNSGLHAEQMLYRTYKSYQMTIGISNYNGPCPTCRAEVGSGSNVIAWYPSWKWSDKTPR